MFVVTKPPFVLSNISSSSCRHVLPLILLTNVGSFWYIFPKSTLPEVFHSLLTVYTLDSITLSGLGVESHGCPSISSPLCTLGENDNFFRAPFSVSFLLLLFSGVWSPPCFVSSPSLFPIFKSSTSSVSSSTMSFGFLLFFSFDMLILRFSCVRLYGVGWTRKDPFKLSH